MSRLLPSWWKMCWLYASAACRLLQLHKAAYFPVLQTLLNEGKHRTLTQTIAEASPTRITCRYKNRLPLLSVTMLLHLPVRVASGHLVKPAAKVIWETRRTVRSKFLCREGLMLLLFIIIVWTFLHLLFLLVVKIRDADAILLVVKKLRFYDTDMLKC